MLAGPERIPMAVEAVLDSYAVKGVLAPLGEVMTYVNDDRRQYLAFEDALVAGMAPGTAMKPLQGQEIMVSKRHVGFISVLEQEHADAVRLVKSSRSVIFFTDRFALQGDLHVNRDFRNDDLLQEGWDFFALTGVTLYPLQPVAFSLTRKVPLLLLQRSHVEAYQVREGGEGEGSGG